MPIELPSFNHWSCDVIPRVTRRILNAVNTQEIMINPGSYPPNVVWEWEWVSDCPRFGVLTRCGKVHWGRWRRSEPDNAKEAWRLVKAAGLACGKRRPEWVAPWISAVFRAWDRL